MVVNHCTTCLDIYVKSLPILFLLAQSWILCKIYVVSSGVSQIPQVDVAGWDTWLCTSGSFIQSCQRGIVTAGLFPRGSPCRLWIDVYITLYVTLVKVWSSANWIIERWFSFCLPASTLSYFKTSELCFDIFFIPDFFRRYSRLICAQHPTFSRHDSHLT